MSLRGRKTRGFTLLELLIVVAIIGLIAALMIPNLLSAIQKAKQKRTMADMRNTGSAWMSWLTDQTSAAAAGTGVFRGTDMTIAVSYEELLSTLSPDDTFFYMQEIQQFDAWLYPYVYAQSPDLTGSFAIAIGSSQSDGNVVDLMVDIVVSPFAATDFVTDIIWSDGYFVRWPDNLSQASSSP